MKLADSRDCNRPGKQHYWDAAAAYDARRRIRGQMSSKYRREFAAVYRCPCGLWVLGRDHDRRGA